MVLAFHFILKLYSCNRMKLHFFKMIISLIQTSLGQPNSTSTHLPPFNRILLPLHTLHVHSLRTWGSGQHQNCLKKKPQGYWSREHSFGQTEDNILTSFAFQPQFLEGRMTPMSTPSLSKLDRTNTMADMGTCDSDQLLLPWPQPISRHHDPRSLCCHD